MPRLIDAEKLRDDILHDPDYDNDTINHFLDLVDEQPEVDDKSDVHAHWIERSNYGQLKTSRCSNCSGILTTHIDAPLKPFCCDCGAKMDEEAEQG